MNERLQTAIEVAYLFFLVAVLVLVAVGIVSLGCGLVEHRAVEIRPEPSQVQR